MSHDHLLALGLLLACLAIPAIIAAWSDRRPPRVGGVLLVAGLALGIHAHVSKPGGYGVPDLPEVVFGALRDLIH